MSTRMIICLDGCGPDCLAAAETPNLDAIAREGFHTIGQAVVPTVTNVNNTSIVTAGFPETHGITSNYLMDPSTGREDYMESPEYLLAETAFRNVARRGGKAVLLTAKDKLKTLIADGAAIAESAEKPSAWLADRVGVPPGIYTVEVNHWLIRAALDLLRDDPPDFLYVSTTDYVNHTYPPGSEPSVRNVREIDRLIGELLNVFPDLELVVTADHGMNAKTRALDLTAILKENGIEAQAVPIIKDRHVVHHQNLGGAAYIYLKDPAMLSEALNTLRQEKGIEAVMKAEAAAIRYRLHPERIGQIFVLADLETVFGSLPAPRQEVAIRSHGSLHERAVPIYGWGPGPMAARPRSNPEVAAWVFAP
ncbi:MAG: alkaline phosphatase family protein [Deltaproteobacteria bacterium]|nr:alkaline phosphatase family protein [Deltaproteobacteria bacterium]